jgi:hypothetical protein
LFFLVGDHAEVYDEERGTQEDPQAHVAPRKTSRHNAHGSQQGDGINNDGEGKLVSFHFSAVLVLAFVSKAKAMDVVALLGLAWILCSKRVRTLNNFRASLLSFKV